MCLDKASDCILETSVTWSQFESHLRNALQTEAQLGPNKVVVDIGEGIGFASRCGLITCDWIGGAEGEELPRRVVLKIPSSIPFRKMNDSLPAAQRVFDGGEEMWARMECNLRNLHNTEVASYDFYEEFEGLALPKCYYGTLFNSEETIGGQICLEFVENSRMMNFHDTSSVEELKQVARAIGKIHACSLKKEATGPELHTDFFTNFYNSRTKAYSGMFKGIFAVDSTEETRELMTRIEANLPAYYDTNLPVTICKQLGIRPVLVNGDLRTENVLFDAETGKLAALIDWQCTHPGVGVEDLHRITLFALSSQDRRSATPMLVDEMYNSFVENLDGAEPPYSLETLLHLSDILFPHCALFFACACISLIQDQKRNPSIADDQKAARIEIVLEKVLGALEDVLEFAAKNKEHVKNLKF